MKINLLLVALLLCKLSLAQVVAYSDQSITGEPEKPPMGSIHFSIDKAEIEEYALKNKFEDKKFNRQLERSSVTITYSPTESTCKAILMKDTFIASYDQSKGYITYALLNKKQRIKCLVLIDEIIKLDAVEFVLPNSEKKYEKIMDYDVTLKQTKNESETKVYCTSKINLPNHLFNLAYPATKAMNTDFAMAFELNCNNVIYNFKVDEIKQEKITENICFDYNKLDAEAVVFSDFLSKMNFNQPQK